MNQVAAKKTFTFPEWDEELYEKLIREIEISPSAEWDEKLYEELTRAAENVPEVEAKPTVKKPAEKKPIALAKAAPAKERIGTEVEDVEVDGESKLEDEPSEPVEVEPALTEPTNVAAERTPKAAIKEPPKTGTGMAPKVTVEAKSVPEVEDMMAEFKKSVPGKAENEVAVDKEFVPVKNVGAKSVPEVAGNKIGVPAVVAKEAIPEKAIPPEIQEAENVLKMVEAIAVPEEAVPSEVVETEAGLEIAEPVDVAGKTVPGFWEVVPEPMEAVPEEAVPEVQEAESVTGKAVSEEVVSKAVIKGVVIEKTVTREAAMKKVIIEVVVPMDVKIEETVSGAVIEEAEPIEEIAEPRVTEKSKTASEAEPEVVEEETVLKMGEVKIAYLEAPKDMDVQNQQNMDVQGTRTWMFKEPGIKAAGGTATKETPDGGIESSIKASGGIAMKETPDGGTNVNMDAPVDMDVRAQNQNVDVRARDVDVLDASKVRTKRSQDHAENMVDQAETSEVGLDELQTVLKVWVEQRSEDGDILEDEVPDIKWKLGPGGLEEELQLLLPTERHGCRAGDSSFHIQDTNEYCIAIKKSPRKVISNMDSQLMTSNYNIAWMEQEVDEDEKEHELDLVEVDRKEEPWPLLPTERHDHQAGDSGTHIKVILTSGFSYANSILPYDTGWTCIDVKRKLVACNLQNVTEARENENLPSAEAMVNEFLPFTKARKWMNVSAAKAGGH